MRILYNVLAGHWGGEDLIGIYVHGDKTTHTFYVTIVPVKAGRTGCKGICVEDINDKIVLAQSIYKLHGELTKLNTSCRLIRWLSWIGKCSQPMQTQEGRILTDDLP